MKKTRMLLAAAAAVAGLVAFAGPAQAEQPPTTTTNYSLAANEYCDFPVSIEYISKQQVRTTSDPDTGVITQVFRGRASAVVTGNGKTLTFHISGPGTITFFPDGAFNIDATGANLLWTTHANSFPGVPTIAYTTGPVHVEVAEPTPNSVGLTTAYTLTSGNSTDVCDLLAS